MKKYLMLIVSMLFLFACDRGEIVSEKSNVYRKRADGYYHDLGPIYGVHRLDTNGDGFEVLAPSYAKDKKQVFYKYYRLKGADPVTFEVLASYYGKDKKHVYFQEDMIKGADPKTFQVMTSFSSKDDKHVFFTYRMVEDADVDSFSIKRAKFNSDGVLLDKDHVFIFDEARDKFYPSTLNFDRDTVEYVEGAYVPLLKDKNGVYWHNVKLPIDVKSFHEDENSTCCWKDKDEKYCRTCNGEPLVLFDTKGHVWK